MTDDQLCTLCQRATDHEGICHKCHRRLHTQLDDLLELWDKAHGELRPGNAGHGSHSSERTIGLNVAALSFIAGSDILGFCHEWEKLIRTDRRLTPPALLPKRALVDELHDAIAFQQAHLEWSGTQPWIEDYAKELRQLHGTGMAAARQFVERVRRIACPADTAEGLPCGSMLPIADNDLLGIVTCRRCGSEWTPLRLVHVALATEQSEIWLDAEAIAGWIGLSERRVRQIAAKNQVPRRGPLIELKAFNETRALA